MSTQQDKILWQKITSRVVEEWDALAADEKKWATDLVHEIVALQDRLHRLFIEVGGASICRDCDGDCCGHGKFHPTLANLLACLILNHPLPGPDFSQYCPYLGEHGCQFPPGLRPFNCISFICEQIENRLAPDRLVEFYRLENEIRGRYELMARRYVGASMRGILIREETLPSYLARR